MADSRRHAIRLPETRRGSTHERVPPDYSFVDDAARALLETVPRRSRWVFTPRRGGKLRRDRGGEEAMTAKEFYVRAMEDPEGQLEQALIEEFLRARGLDSVTLHTLPDDKAKRVLTEASVYASARLAEVDARAHFVHRIHGDE
jgi:hypothetical protein